MSRWNRLGRPTLGPWGGAIDRFGNPSHHPHEFLILSFDLSLSLGLSWSHKQQQRLPPPNEESEKRCEISEPMDVSNENDSASSFVESGFINGEADISDF